MEFVFNPLFLGKNFQICKKNLRAINSQLFIVENDFDSISKSTSQQYFSAERFSSTFRSLAERGTRVITSTVNTMGDVPDATRNIVSVGSWHKKELLLKRCKSYLKEKK